MSDRGWAGWRPTFDGEICMKALYSITQLLTVLALFPGSCVKPGNEAMARPALPYGTFLFMLVACSQTLAGRKSLASSSTGEMTKTFYCGD